jgi:KDO2-lipid IV(A) lauroyltransferase
VIRPAGKRPSRTEPKPRPITAAGIRGALSLLSQLSLPVLHALGSIAGTLAWLLPTPLARNTKETLAIALPDLSPAERRVLARRSLVHSSRMMLEHSAFWFWKPERVLGLLRSADGDRAIRDAVAARRGVIVAGTHLGAIDAVSVFCAREFSISSQYREPRIRELDGLFRQARERFGGRLLPIGSRSVRALLKALDRGEVIGIPCDQDPGEGAGVFVPFFGRLTNTMTLIPRLASSTGALVVVAYAERLPRSEGFALHFVPAPQEVGGSDLARSAAALNRTVEACVLRLPEQYLWSYRRFRIRVPEGVKS